VRDLLKVCEPLREIENFFLHSLGQSSSFTDSLDIFSEDLLAAHTFASKSFFKDSKDLLLLSMGGIFNADPAAVMDSKGFYATMRAKVA
jgi:hypothetical protein